MAKDGKVVIETNLDSGGFESGLSKMGSIAKSGLKAVTVSVGAASTAIAGLVTASVKSAADYEQLAGGVETFFGAGGKNIEQYAEKVGKTVDSVRGEYENLMKSQEKVLADADEAYKTAGLSANEYMETVTSFSATLIQSLGGDTQKAAEYSKRAVIDMSDNANKTGTSIEMIQNAYNGFAKQNYTMLDNLKLSYGGTKKEMERLIGDASKMKDVQKELGVTVDANSMSFGNIVNAISVIQSKMGITGTTMEEAEHTISGSIGMMKASWENLMTGMATSNADFDGLIGQFLESIKTVADNVVPVVKVALDRVLILVQELIPEIANALPIIINEYLPVIIDTGVKLLNALITGISENMETIGQSVLTIIMTLVNAILDNLPQILEMGMELIIQLALGIAEAMPELVPKIINCIITMMKVFNEHIDEFLMAGIKIILGLIQGLIKAIPDILKNLPTIIMAIVNFFSISKFLKLGSVVIKGLLNGLLTGITTVLKAIPGLIGKIISAFKGEGLGSFLNLGKNLLTGLWNGMSGFLPNLLGKIGGMAKSIVNKFKDFFKIKSPSRLMRDEIGQYLGSGISVGLEEGFGDTIGDAFNEMQKTIDLESQKVVANVETGNVYNNIMNPMPIDINNNNSTTIELDGEVLTNVVNKTNTKKSLQYGF